MKSAIQKLYYSITEVSKIVGEEQHVLRYWEREFPQLKPQKNRAGNRVYTERDLAMLRIIRRLLRSERYTVAGAKEYLRQHGSLEELEQEFLDGENVEVGVAGDGASKALLDGAANAPIDGASNSPTDGAVKAPLKESNEQVVSVNGSATAEVSVADEARLAEEAKVVVDELRSIAAELRSRASA